MEPGVEGKLGGRGLDEDCGGKPLRGLREESVHAFVKKQCGVGPTHHLGAQRGRHTVAIAPCSLPCRSKGAITYHGAFIAFPGAGWYAHRLHQDVRNAPAAGRDSAVLCVL